MKKLNSFGTKTSVVFLILIAITTQTQPTLAMKVLACTVLFLLSTHFYYNLISTAGNCLGYLKGRDSENDRARVFRGSYQSYAHGRTDGLNLWT